MAKYFKSKTIIFSMTLGILGAIQANIGAIHMDAQSQGLALLCIGITSAILRIVTTQPLDAK